MKDNLPAPFLTAIVIFYQGQREAPRTLQTLSAAYQSEVDESEYEVWAIDNGSAKPLDPAMVKSFGSNFHYHYFPTDSISPVEAIIHFLDKVTTPYVMLMIDGAHMITPKVIKYTKDIAQFNQNPFIYTIPFHLGPYRQNDSMTLGYNQTEEDKLLASVDWQINGYSLFDICNISSVEYNYFVNVLESNCFIVKTEELKRNPGLDTRFQSSGGGMVNLAIFEKFVLNERFTTYELFGEASFHQYHGGTSTNINRADHPITFYREEYEKIAGQQYVAPLYKALSYGRVSTNVRTKVIADPRRTLIKYVYNLARIKKYDSAIDLIDELIKLDQFYLISHTVKVNILTEMGKYDEAIKVIKNLIKINPTAIEDYYILLVKTYIGSGQNEIAQDYCEKLILINPNNIQAKFYLIQIKHANNIDLESIPNLLKSIIKSIKSRYFQQNRIMPAIKFSFENKYTDIALEMTDITLKLHPDIAKLYIIKARCLMRKKKFEDAIENLTKAMSINSKQMPISNKLIGDCYAQLGEIESGLQHYQKAKIMSDENPNLRSNVIKEISKLQDIKKRQLENEQYKSVIFTHIPKTGGMSLRQFMVDTMLSSGIAEENIYAPGSLGLHPFKNLIQLTSEEAKQLDKKEILALLDHSPFGMEQRLKIHSLKDPFRFTVIRNPINRVISNYNYMNYQAGLDGLQKVPIHLVDIDTLEDVLRKDQNMHVNYLSGQAYGHQTSEEDYNLALNRLQSEFAVIGIFERMDEFIKLMKILMPTWMHKGARLQQINNNSYKSSPNELEQTRLELIEKYNYWDIKLYDESIALFDQKLKKHGIH